MPVATKLAIDMVFSAITPSDMKRKSEKAESFYAIPPPSPKRRRKTHRYLIKHNANKLFVMDDITLPVTDDGMLYAIEFICVLTNQSKANAVKKLGKLPNSWFQDHTLSNAIKVMTFDKALIASMLITGKIASALRLKFGCFIARYLSGEDSLVEDRVLYDIRTKLDSPTGDIEAYDPVVAVPMTEDAPDTAGIDVQLPDSSGAFL